MSSLSITERLAIHRRVGHGDPAIYDDAIAEIARLERELAEARAEVQSMRGRCENCTAKNDERERCIRVVEHEAFPAWRPDMTSTEVMHEYKRNIIARINAREGGRNGGGSENS